MTRPFCVLVAMTMVAVRAGAQNPPTPPPSPQPAPAPAPTPAARPAPPPTQSPQIDCNWLTVDSASKTATFLLTAGLTGLNGGLNFNGYKDGALTFSVPVNWNVVIEFTNHDGNLTHSAEVIDTVKPVPPGPVDPSFPRAMTVRLTQGIATDGKDTMRFTANKPGSYLIFCAVPGHGLAGMWIRFRVSATDTKPALVSTASAGGR
ncbi:MAG TPA: sulfocyanin-like copper-binding protein [Gemmatimonadales bacterium]|nr:sulfocyanin-like copper-binding protein [Gemmatimonadales bacterium]